MQVQFTVVGDDLIEIAEELEKIAAQFRGQIVAAKAVEDAKPKAEPKKEKPKAEKPKKPEPEEEKAEAPAEDAKEEAVPDVSPEEAWQAAVDLLMEFWDKNPDGKDRILSVSEQFGVQKFKEIPTERGHEFLDAARKAVAG